MLLPDVRGARQKAVSAIRKARLGIYALTHFCVDFACFYMLFAWYSSETHSAQTVTIGFLAYNVIAFGLQPIIGYLCDTHGKIPIEVIGCPLLIAGLPLMRVPAASILLMGLGNACFHIAGGIDSLRFSGGKMARSGVFVSTGALGVAFGSLAGKSGSLPMYFPIGALSLCLFLLYAFCYRPREMKPVFAKTAFATVKPELKFGKAVFLVSVSIFVRSYAGAILPADWRTTSVLFVFPAIGAFIGKAAGGFAADWLGARNTSVISLLAAMAMLAFGYMNPWLYLTGMILFNMNMSVTLCAIASKLPAHPGLAFGITTLALLCGNIPTFFLAIKPAPPVFAALTAISAACLYHALKKGRAL